MVSSPWNHGKIAEADSRARHVVGIYGKRGIVPKAVIRILGYFSSGQKMFDWLRRFYFGSEEVEFESSFGIDESVDLLRSSTRRSVFSAISEQQAVGTVKKDHVSLQRVIPMVGNSFKPFFRGRFIERNGKVYLIGRFTPNFFVKIFMTIWFGGVASFFVLSLLLACVKPNANSAILPLSSAGMFALGVTFVRGCMWFARNDAPWLSNVITRSLGNVNSFEQSRDPQAAVDQRPMVLKVVAAVLCLSAVMSIFATSGDMNSAQIGKIGTTIARNFPGFYSKNAAMVYALFVLVLAYGVFNRYLLAWRAGLVLIVFACGYSMVNIFLPGAGFDAPSPVIKYVFAILSVIITLIWLRWWHAQRVHFLN